MADIYQVKWKQSINKGNGNQLYDFVSTTDKAVWDANAINTAWNNSGCYAGANAQNGSLMGAGCGCNFSGWNADTGKSDMRNFTISPSYYSGTQNLRFMIDFGSSGRGINKKTFNWTGLSDDQKTSIENAYLKEGDEGYRTNLLNSISVYSPYNRAYFNSSINGIANTPLNIAPLNELKINDLIWLPKFLIKEIEYYNYNDVAAGYRNQTTTAGTWYTWDEIKPEDKSEAGEYYDEDLFTKGYKEITAVNEDGVRFKYVAGVHLCPYYGKSSSTYNPSNDTYIAGTNPDDGFVYSSRQIFGTYTSDASTYPIVGSYTTNRPLLYVCSETYNETTDGIIYQLPAGIIFSNTGASGTISSNFDVQSQWAFTTNAQLFTNGGISIYYTNFWMNNNQNYNGFFKGVDDPTVDSVNPDFYMAGSIAEIDGSWISTAMDDSTYPTAVHYYLQNNSPMSFSFAKTNRSINPQTLSYFSIQELWATIASLGCYVAGNTECATTAQTGHYVGNNNHLYLGKMDASGITDGTMVQGSDIANQPQAGIDDIIQHTPYVPVIPTPGGGGGGDDPDDPSVPKNDQGSIPYNSTLPVVGAATSFLTSYILNTAQVNAVGYNLWSKVNSNTETDARAMLSNFYRLNNSGDVNVDYGLTLAEIPDYFVSLRWFPFSLGNSVDKVSTGESAIRVGTGLTPISAGNSTTYTIQNAMCYLEGGTMTVPWTYESYLDYEPYTSASIYIPYCGTTEVQPSLIMGRTLSLHYSVSLLTGAICAIIMVQSSNGVSYPLCVMNGMVGFDIAITGNTQNAQIRNALSARDNYYLGQWNSITSGLKSVGATAGISSLAGSMSSGTAGAGGMESIRNFLTDANSMGLKGAIGEAFKYNANLFNGALGAAAGLTIGSSVASAVGGLALQHQAYENSLPFVYGTQPLVVGSSSSMANLILPQTAFVQIRRKNRHDLSSDVYGNTYGYESKNSKRLGDLNGFTKCVNPKLSISGATESELNLIYGYLQTGVYL
jgi:hypothetical protein